MMIMHGDSHMLMHGHSNSFSHARSGRIGVMLFDKAELAAATDDFGAANLIREGGFGKVFKGVLRDTKVAVKVMKQVRFQCMAIVVSIIIMQQQLDVSDSRQHLNMSLTWTCVGMNILSDPLHAMTLYNIHSQCMHADKSLKFL